MPVYTLKNHYRGVNAHLHSYWQVHGGWNNFHNPHISDIARLLRGQLRPLGYTATVEESLQLRRLAEAVAPEDAEKPYRALAVRPLTAGDVGNPVAWLELLSPTNKGSTPDAATYQLKRRALLENGLVFVELDYLHHTPPTLHNVPDYTRRDPGATPYRVAVLDPRPDLATGPVYLGAFGADDPIPPMTIPLAGDDSLVFDFGAAYNKTYTEMGYGLEQVDYAALPAQFDAYTAHDQTRVLCRCIAILAALAQGDDLESTDLTPPSLPLDAAHEQFAVLCSP